MCRIGYLIMASYAGMMAPPGYPNTVCTPWRIRHSHRICAPVFFLLAGTGAYLGLRRRSRAELSRFLLTRGLWLIVLEIVVVRFVMQFNAREAMHLIELRSGPPAPGVPVLGTG